LSVSPSAGASGSLDSISPADFESTSTQDDNKRNSNAADSSDFFGDDDDKDVVVLPGIKYEKWWEISLQVSIPFMIAGMGTIGAGIVLGRLEVSIFIKTNSLSMNRLCNQLTL
jgi:hypothetical protein